MCTFCITIVCTTGFFLFFFVCVHCVSHSDCCVCVTKFEETCQTKLTFLKPDSEPDRDPSVLWAMLQAAGSSVGRQYSTVGSVLCVVRNRDQYCALSGIRTNAYKDNKNKKQIHTRCTHTSNKHTHKKTQQSSSTAETSSQLLIAAHTNTHTHIYTLK